MTTPESLRGSFLLCIDMQPAFVRAVVDGPRVLQRCHLALAAAQGFGLRCGFTEQVPEKLGRTEAGLLATDPNAPVWGKLSFSVFDHEPCRKFLMEDAGTEHLLLCGIETPICVYQTALAARATGLQVTVLSDAVGARRPEDARECLQTLRHAGVHVLPTETVFYALLQDVKHPFFKPYTELVKSHA